MEMKNRGPDNLTVIGRNVSAGVATGSGPHSIWADPSLHCKMGEGRKMKGTARSLECGNSYQYATLEAGFRGSDGGHHHFWWCVGAELR
jgi:hypothetical protein